MTYWGEMSVAERSADLFIDRRRSDRDPDDFCRLATFADPQRFFDGDLVERIDHRLGRRNRCASQRSVVRVGYALKRDQDFHRSAGVASQSQHRGNNMSLDFASAVV